jgi:hypothetical protein
LNGGSHVVSIGWPAFTAAVISKRAIISLVAYGFERRVKAAINDAGCDVANDAKRANLLDWN